jgi:hypothetical protein
MDITEGSRKTKKSKKNASDNNKSVVKNNNSSKDSSKRKKTDNKRVRNQKNQQQPPSSSSSSSSSSSRKKKPIQDNESMFLLLDILFNKRPKYEVRLKLNELIKKYEITHDMENFLSFVEQRMDKIPYSDWCEGISRKTELARKAIAILQW